MRVRRAYFRFVRAERDFGFQTFASRALGKAPWSQRSAFALRPKRRLPKDV
jgi:hypothetical protein